MKKKFALLICVLFSYNTVWAQAPTIDDMHKALEYAAQETNRQLSIKKISVDEFTTLNAMTYNRLIPAMTYNYTSTAFKLLGNTTVSPEARKAMFEHHRAKTCSTHFLPFMRAFGLKVAHRFDDASTGREVITVTIKGSDCPIN